MRYEWLPGDIVILDGVPVARLETVDGEVVVVTPGRRDPAQAPGRPDERPDLVPDRGRSLLVVRDGHVVARLAPSRPFSRRPILDCEDPLPVLTAVRLLVVARRRWSR